MSPSLFVSGEYRFYFFSKEEHRTHIHVVSGKGEAKFWLEPIVALANNHGFSAKELNKIQFIVQDKQNEIKAAWKKHFNC